MRFANRGLVGGQVAQLYFRRLGTGWGGLTCVKYVTFFMREARGIHTCTQANHVKIALFTNMEDKFPKLGEKKYEYSSLLAHLTLWLAL